MKLNTEQLDQVIEDVMSELNLSYEMQTDVALIGEILNEIKLDDFQTSYLPMKRKRPVNTLEAKNKCPLIFSGHLKS